MLWVEDLGFRVQGLGFRVQGFGFRTNPLNEWLLHSNISEALIEESRKRSTPLATGSGRHSTFYRNLKRYP